MVTEGDTTSELNYLSGCILAHETMIIHMAKMLAVSGLTSENSLQELLKQMARGDLKPEDSSAGYHETLVKMGDSLTDIR